MPKISELDDQRIAEYSDCVGDDADAGDSADADADASVLKTELGPEPLTLMKAR